MKRATHVYRLTKMVLAGLSSHGLEPVLAQRTVISEMKRIGTAADMIAYNRKENRLVVVELKCGFDCGRSAPAMKDGKPCKMEGPLHGASDCNVNRHLAQLAVTRELFVREKATMDRIGELGLEREVAGVLMYANDEGVETHDLDEWWKKRAVGVLGTL